MTCFSFCASRSARVVLCNVGPVAGTDIPFCPWTAEVLMPRMSDRPTCGLLGMLLFGMVIGGCAGQGLVQGQTQRVQPLAEGGFPGPQLALGLGKEQEVINVAQA